MIKSYVVVTSLCLLCLTTGCQQRGAPASKSVTPPGATNITAVSASIMPVLLKVYTSKAENPQQPVESFPSHSGTLSISVSPDGEWLGLMGEVISLKTKEPARKFGNSSLAPAFTDDGKSIAICEWESGIGTVLVGKPDSANDDHEIAKLDLDKTTLNQLAISHDGQWVAGALGSSDSQATFRVWSAKDGSEKQTLKADLGQRSYADGVVLFSPDDQLILGGYNLTLMAWNVSNGEVAWKFVFENDDQFHKLRMVRYWKQYKGYLALLDNTLVLLGANGELRSRIKLFEAPDENAENPVTIKYAAASPTSALIAISVENDKHPIYLFDFSSNSYVGTLLGNVSDGAFAFSADGKQVISTDFDNVHVWNVPGK